MLTWTLTQKQRLTELNAPAEEENRTFASAQERDRAFQELEKALIQQGKRRLAQLKEVTRRPALCRLERKLADALMNLGFVQVTTPIIISKGMLAKMSITPEHPLYHQVFWLDEKKCLRPMLAPNLYALWKELSRLWERPIRLFEIGSCFRKESQGAHHLNEFTMLNLAELGTPMEKRKERLTELVQAVMEAAGIADYKLEEENSVVYGDTVDVTWQGLELGSGVIGPNPLDDNWGILEPWVGIGFGLERLLLVKEGGKNVQRLAKSITYLDGVRLNII